MQSELSLLDSRKRGMPRNTRKLNGSDHSEQQLESNLLRHCR